MRLLLDANLPRSALTTALDLGFEADLARDIGLGNATDSDIARRARETRAILVTRDLDFADIRSYPIVRKSRSVQLSRFDSIISA